MAMSFWFLSSCSGEVYRRSSSPAASERITSSRSAEDSIELSVAARTPLSPMLSTWSNMRESSGETISVQPSNTAAAAWKHMLLPAPVGCTQSTSRATSGLHGVQARASNKRAERCSEKAWGGREGRRADGRAG